MGPELFGLVLLVALAVGAVLFFSGAFGAGAAGSRKGESRPKHVFVEDETRGRVVGGGETADRLREDAEGDPETEVR